MDSCLHTCLKANLTFIYLVSQNITRYWFGIAVNVTWFCRHHYASYTVRYPNIVCSKSEGI